MKKFLLLCLCGASAFAQETPAPAAVEGVRGVRQEGAGKVKEIAYLGAHSTYVVSASDSSRIKITEANTARHGLGDIAREDDVYFWWQDDAAVVLRD